MINTTDDLDAHQRAAVAATAPTLLITAPAGSGKTRTIIARVRRWLDEGVPPQEICAVTFTTAGAKTMAERLGGVRFGSCSTLHALMLRLLQKLGKSVGLPERISVMDEDAAAESMADVLESMRLTGAFTEQAVADAVASRRKSAVRGKSKLDIAVEEYFMRQRASGELDFDNVLAYGLKLARLLAVSVTGAWPFTHLVWDEFQDSSDADAAIFKALPCGHKTACGDANQAIYGFRGGNVGHILALAEQPGVAVLPLVVNYRSAVSIVEASQRLIAHNTARLPSPVSPRPDAPQGRVEVRECADPASELAFVAHALNGRPQGSTAAVLFRTNALADQCRQYLRGLGVAVAETRAPRQAPEAVAGRAALSFMANPWSDSAALRLVKAQKGDVKQLHAHCDFNGTSVAGQLNGILYDVQQDGQFELEGFEGLLNMLQCLKPTTRSWLLSLAATVPAPFTLGDLVAAANERDVPEPEAGDSVTVSTVHGVKGKEFDSVFFCGLEAEAWDKQGTIEEERRLAYVAVTRARERLFVTWCATRPAPGRNWVQERRTPSRFIWEMRINKPKE